MEVLICVDGKHIAAVNFGMALAGRMEGFCREKGKTSSYFWVKCSSGQCPRTWSLPLFFCPFFNFKVTNILWLLLHYLYLFSFLSPLAVVLFPSGLSPVTLSDSLQMDVVSAFQSGTSFQGALRRQASNSSQQQHDVTNVSSPTHVAFSTTTTTATAANSASTTVGCECVFSFSAWDFSSVYIIF